MKYSCLVSWFVHCFLVQIINCFINLLDIDLNCASEILQPVLIDFFENKVLGQMQVVDLAENSIQMFRKIVLYDAKKFMGTKILERISEKLEFLDRISKEAFFEIITNGLNRCLNVNELETTLKNLIDVIQ